jgi:hypothetical protein
MYMTLTCVVCLQDKGVILMNLFTVQYHVGLMTWKFYYHWIRVIYHATTLWILYVNVVYQLDREWCPPSLAMTSFVVTLLVRILHG